MESTPNYQQTPIEKGRFGIASIIAAVIGLLALGWIISMAVSGRDRHPTASRTDEPAVATPTESLGTPIESTSPTSGVFPDEDDYGFDEEPDRAPSSTDEAP